MNKGANLYFIKSNDKYLNGQYNTWHEKAVLATYATTEKNAIDLANHFSIVDYEIEKVSEYDFTGLLANETTRLIIQMDSILVQLEQLRFQIPTISQINKVTHKHLKNTCESLKVINPYFNSFIKSQEDATFDVKAVYDSFIHELAKLELWDCENLTYILKAYQKDPNSIKGISKKILK